MTGKIGFVDTDNPPDYQKPQMGRIEDQEDERREFWLNLIVSFLMVFGAISLIKEVVIFLVNLKKRGLIPFFSFKAFNKLISTVQMEA